MFDLESYIIVHVKFKGTLDLAGFAPLVVNIQKLLIKEQLLTQQLIIYKTIFLNSQQLTTHNLIHGLRSDLSKELDASFFQGCRQESTKLRVFMENILCYQKMQSINKLQVIIAQQE